MTAGDPPKRSRRAAAIWIVLAVAFAARATILVLAGIATADPRVHHSPDTKAYVALAEELHASARFQRGGEPEIVRTPGYPLLLLPGIALGKLEATTVALQIVLSCLTVYLVYRICLALFGRTAVALLGAALYALEPLSIIYSSILLTETLFTFTTALFLYCLVGYLKGGGPLGLVVAAVALAASAYVRPVSYFLPLVVGLGLLVRAAFTRPIRRRLFVHAGVFFAVAMGLVAAWQVRNAALTGYGGFSAIADANLYFYQAASVLAADEDSSYYEMQKRMGYRDEEVYLREHPEQANWTRAQRYRHMGRKGREILIRHPMTYAKIHVKGMARALLDPGAFEYLKLFKAYPQSGGLLGVVVDKGVVSAARTLYDEQPRVFWSNLGLGVVLGVYLLFGAISLFFRSVRKHTGAVACALVALYFLVLSGGPHALGRFRHPIMPVICILAAAGMAGLTRRFRRKTDA